MSKKIIDPNGRYLLIITILASIYALIVGLLTYNISMEIEEKMSQSFTLVEENIQKASSATE